MAWIFDGVNDSVTMAANAAIEVPDADWTLGGFAQHGASSGVDGGYFEAFNTTQDITFGTYGNGKVFLHVQDDAGDSLYIESATTPMNNTTRHHIMVVRSGTSYNIYVDNSSVASGTGANVDASTTLNTVRFGLYNDGANHYINATLSEWAKWNAALDSTQRGNLGSGYSPHYYATELKWHVPMRSGDYTEKIVPITVTNSGSTGTTHPTVFYPVAPSLLTNSSTIYGLTVVGLYTLTPPLFTNTSTVYAPSVVSIIAPPLYTNSQTFFGPTVVGLGSTLTPPLVDSTIQIFAPTVIPGQVTVSPSLYTNTSTIYNPTVTFSYLLEPPLVTSTEIIYEPAVVGQNTIVAPLHTNTTTIYGPTVVGQYQLLPSLVMSGVVIYPPALVYTQVISPPLVPSAVIIYGPIVFGEGFSLVTPDTATFTEVTPDTADFTLSPGTDEDFDLVS